jgi:hypothetical protein
MAMLVTVILSWNAVEETRAALRRRGDMEMAIRFEIRIALSGSLNHRSTRNG